MDRRRAPRGNTDRDEEDSESTPGPAFSTRVGQADGIDSHAAETSEASAGSMLFSACGAKQTTDVGVREMWLIC
jgi:hypothetical protein